MFLIENDWASMIIESTKDVFETMMFMDLEEYPEIPDDGLLLKTKITGIISVEGKYTGKIMVHCDKVMALLITSNLLGLEPENSEVVQRVDDAIGEISNMVAGNIKGKFSEQEDAFELHPPEVVFHDNVPIQKMKESDGVIVPFFSEDNYLWVELLVQEKK